MASSFRDLILGRRGVSNPGSGPIMFECIRLKGTNKVGRISPDKDGCYTQCIGGLNAFNSVGDFYSYKGAEQFFSEQSALQRKIRRGVLRAEYGHPKQNNLSDVQFGRRILTIEETKVCGTWRKVWLSQESLTDDKGRKIIPIMGSIFPKGPYGQCIKEDFETAAENVCYSIRSFTNNEMNPDGTYTKILKEIITWDYVNEPGIYNAEKLLSPGLESIDSHSFKAQDLIESMEKATNGQSLEDSGFSMEFMSQLRDIVELEQKKPTMPNFMKW